MDRPLNGKQIMDIAGYRVRIIPYTEVNDTSLNYMLSLNNACLINYLYEDRMGHWCALKRNGKSVTFFNPSGGEIDDMIDILNKLAKDPRNDVPGGQDKPYLTKHLLRENIYNDTEIRYMDYPLQDPNTSTCGRWCGLFLRYPELTEDEFIDIFKNFNDKQIVQLTEPLL